MTNYKYLSLRWHPIIADTKTNICKPKKRRMSQYNRSTRVNFKVGFNLINLVMKFMRNTEVRAITASKTTTAKLSNSILNI